MSDPEKKYAELHAIYVDAVQGHTQVYSCQLVFGAHGLDGEVEPKVHLTMSPTFAVQLARVLAEIVEPYGAAREREQGPQ